jgi:outer membrane immunogenic protein
VKSLIASAAVLAAAAFAAPAFAQNLPVLGAATYNAGAGYTGLNTQGLGFGMATLRAGADFGKYVGVEAEGAFGVIDQTPTLKGVSTSEHINDEYAAYAVARYPVLADANLFVRGGFGHTDIKASPLMRGAVTSGYDSWNYGAGGEYFFDGKNGVRAEYTRMSFQDRGLRDADTFTVSYVHKF